MARASKNKRIDEVCVCVCVLAMNNKAQAQRVSNREFKLWTFLQGTQSRVATFLAEVCVCECYILAVWMQYTPLTEQSFKQPAVIDSINIIDDLYIVCYTGVILVALRSHHLKTHLFHSHLIIC